MKRLGFVIVVTLFSTGSYVYADVLNSGASVAVSSAFNPTGAFWNNTSSDVVNGSVDANVGNFLSATGGFASSVTGCSTCGPNYMANGGQMYVNSGNTPDYVSNLNFVTQAGGLEISLLYANSGENSLASFGIYDAANPEDIVVLQAAGVNLNNNIGMPYTSGTQFAGATNLGSYNLSNGSPYANWGLYVTTCTEGTISVSQCALDGDLVTYYMGAASTLNPGQTPYDTGHEHFALFQSGTNVNQYYAGVEDFAFTRADPTNPVEGYGDYNDLIFGITSSIGTTVPEPATLPILALGLAGLAFFGRRRFCR